MPDAPPTGQLAPDTAAAVAHAVALARSASGRDLIVEVHYTPDTALLPPAVDPTLLCPHGDIDHIRSTFDTAGAQIAAVLVDPLPHTLPSVHPATDFDPQLRELCDQYGTALVFVDALTAPPANTDPPTREAAR